MNRELSLTSNKEYWTFPCYKNTGVNSIADYPAMMVDAMQEALIDAALRKIDCPKTLLDPFCGAGTTLIVAQKKGIFPIGIDINPLAHLISYVKLFDYDVSSLEDSRKLLEERLFDDKPFDCVDFPGISKWFREDIRYDLSKIRSSIILENNRDFRRFFWVAFANVVRKYCNSRSSTFKLHIKDEAAILGMENHVISDFLNVLSENISKISVSYSKGDFSLYCGDSASILDSIANDSIDIICTSPPYGDNATTVTYGQFSTLQLRWIDAKDLVLSNPDINSRCSSIDSKSLGGKLYCVETDVPSINKCIKKISPNKRSKVASFIADYGVVFKKMIAKIRLGGYLILTVGNRKVDNVSVPFSQANIELAKKNGLELVQKLSRRIINKRMASRVSHLADVGSVESMKEETILIFAKKEQQ